MLSRVANAIYWTSRYLERSENICRFIYVNLHHMMDLDIDNNEFWFSLVMASGDEELFLKNYKDRSKESILKFLVLDKKNPNSIVSCTKLARENARTIREVISAKMWEDINNLYWLTEKFSKKKKLGKELEGFLSNFQSVYLSFLGSSESTMNHHEAWHFLRTGRLLERADKTGRILDVKYFQLQATHKSSEDARMYSVVISKSLLKSASALEMYKKNFPQINPHNVASYLISSNFFPRSMMFCLVKIQESLTTILEFNKNPHGELVAKEVEKLVSEILEESKKELHNKQVHRFIDVFQDNLNHLDTLLYKTFFSSEEKIEKQQETSYQQQG